MITQQITQFPEAPNSATDTPQEFNSKADAFVGHQAGTYVGEVNTWAGQANATKDEINTAKDSASASALSAQNSAQEASQSAQSASSSANFMGEWDNATTYNIPSSVYYNGKYYNTLIDGNTGHDPETSPTQWVEQALDLIPPMAIGNINNPLLDLPLNNSLDMKQGVGDVTFERASTATYVDRYGVVQTALADEARFEKEGLLIEGASTNICLQSEDFSTSWSTANTTVTTNNTTAPDGTTTADKIDKAAVTFAAISQFFTVGVGDQTGSFFVKAGTLSEATIMITENGSGTVLCRGIVDLTDGSVTVQTGTPDNFKVRELADEWYRISASVTGTLTDARLYLYPDDYANAIAGNIYVWGAQFEELPFATSYIPTTTTAVTRSQDIFDIEPYNNVPFANSISISVDTAQNGFGSNARIFDIGHQNTSFLRLGLNGEDNYQLVSFNYANSIVNTDMTKMTRFIAIANGLSIGLGVDGELMGVGGLTNSDFSQPTKLYIGRNVLGTEPMFGHIKNLRIWGEDLTLNEAKLA